jgi:tRNA-Thr(GGU) m(6)t(6)A37 methyltransferase TsaA
MNIVLQPVAFVKNGRMELSDDFWGTVISEIELAPGIPAEAFNGIDDFSHLEIIFYFDKSDKSEIVFSGHPRGNKEWPHTGIFAQRKKDRPNALGLTIAELVKREGNKIWVKFLDAVDGTPIVDIKPVLKEFLPNGEIRQPAWSNELMKEYWL